MFVTFSDGTHFAIFVGIHSLALIAPYAMLFVTVGDPECMNLASAEKEKIVEICERNDIEFCAVFGSFARGEATAESDIDLLVRFSKPKGIDWIDAALEIEDTLGRKVDLITEKSLHPLIRASVYKDLQIFYGERKFDSVEAHS